MHVVEKENNLLKDRESYWEEKLKARDRHHLAELEGLHQSSKEDFKIYKEDTRKNLTESLPKLKSNLVLHAQVVTRPLNLSQAGFNYL